MRKYKIILILIALLSLCTIAWSVSAASLAIEESTAVNALSEIEDTYESIQQLVDNGDLSSSVGTAAKSIYIEFRKSLIRSDAEAQILDLEFNAAANADEADWLYFRLSQVKNERDARILTCLGLLQAIENSRSSDVVPPEPPSLSHQDKAAHPSGINWQTRELDIEIEIAPEDITSGDRE